MPFEVHNGERSRTRGVSGVRGRDSERGKKERNRDRDRDRGIDQQNIGSASRQPHQRLRR